MHATLLVPLDLPLHGDVAVADGAVVRDRDGSILGHVVAAWRNEPSEDLHVRVSLSIEADALFGAGGLTGVTLRDAAPPAAPVPTGEPYDALGRLRITKVAPPPNFVDESDPLPPPRATSFAARAAAADPDTGNPLNPST